MAVTCLSESSLLEKFPALPTTATRTCSSSARDLSTNTVWPVVVVTALMDGLIKGYSAFHLAEFSASRTLLSNGIVCSTTTAMAAMWGVLRGCYSDSDLLGGRKTYQFDSEEMNCVWKLKKFQKRCTPAFLSPIQAQAWPAFPGVFPHARPAAAINPAVRGGRDCLFEVTENKFPAIVVACPAQYIR